MSTRPPLWFGGSLSKIAGNDLLPIPRVVVAVWLLSALVEQELRRKPAVRSVVPSPLSSSDAAELAWWRHLRSRFAEGAIPAVGSPVLGRDLRVAWVRNGVLVDYPGWPASGFVLGRIDTTTPAVVRLSGLLAHVARPVSRDGATMLVPDVAGVLRLARWAAAHPVRFGRWLCDQRVPS